MQQPSRLCTAVVTTDAGGATAAPQQAPSVLDTNAVAVLDTNAVLDAWLFRDPSAAPLRAAVEAGAVRWVATAAMRSELAQVAARAPLAARGDGAAAVLAAFDCWAVVGDAPAPEPWTPARQRWRCRDPDDQRFVDLALAAGARWLVSKDRAVLALTRALAPRGVGVIRTDCWHRDGVVTPVPGVGVGAAV